MYYFDYFIKYLIRRLTRMIFKPRNILIIVLILLISLFLNISSFAAESNIFEVYSSFNNDLIIRLQKVSSTSSFYNYFNDYHYNFLVYYGNNNGSDMFNSSYDTSILNVAFYPVNMNFSDTEASSTWANCSTTRGFLSSNSSSIIVYSYQINGEYTSTNISYLNIPSDLYNYRSPVVNDYLQNRQNIQEITSSVTEGTNKINNTLSDTNDFIKDDSIEDSSMNVDTSGYEIEGQASIDNFFTQFLNTIHDKFVNMTSEVETITIPMPYNMDSIVLSSDIISKHIKDTTLYSLIQVFWTFVFGRYIVMFIKRIFDWLSTGEIADKGVFSFIEWLDVNNEIIKSYMM